MKSVKSHILLHNRIFLIIAGGVLVLLLVPLTAMQFNADVHWSPLDFLTAGSLMFVSASLYVLAARRFTNHRLFLAIAFAVVFLYIWAELAVGIFTNWGS